MPSPDPTPQALAAALFLANLGDGRDRPLSLGEFRTLEGACAAAGVTLAEVPDMEPDQLTATLGLAPELAAKTLGLARRGTELAFDLEQLSSRGIRLICDTDPDYPDRWRQRLTTKCPPIAYLCGDPTLCNPERAVSVAGSRDVDPAGDVFAQLVGEVAANNCALTVTGGARGVDRAAMAGALEAGGAVMGVLAGGMAEEVRRTDPGLLSGAQVALICPWHPKQRWAAGLAMARNRLIHCLGDAAIIVSSSDGEGGTWSGAIEVLTHQWVPLFVRGVAGNSGAARQAGRAEQTSVVGEVGQAGEASVVGEEVVAGKEAAVPAGNLALIGKGATAITSAHITDVITGRLEPDPIPSKTKPSNQLTLFS